MTICVWCYLEMLPLCLHWIAWYRLTQVVVEKRPVSKCLLSSEQRTELVSSVNTWCVYQAQHLHMYAAAETEHCCIVTLILCGSVAINCRSLCLYRSHISRATCPNFKFFMYITCGKGSVLLWQHYDMLCTWSYGCVSTFSGNLVHTHAQKVAVRWVSVQSSSSGICIFDPGFLIESSILQISSVFTPGKGDSGGSSIQSDSSGGSTGLEVECDVCLFDACAADSGQNLSIIIPVVILAVLIVTGIIIFIAWRIRRR